MPSQPEKTEKYGYIVATTAAWFEPENPEFVKYHGVFSTVEAANACARSILSKEIGTFQLEFMDDGCLLVSRKSEYGTVKTGKSKKDVFKVQVTKISLDEPQLDPALVHPVTFTKKIDLILCTLVYRKFKPHQPALLSSETIKSQKFFLTKKAALVHYQAVKLAAMDPRVREIHESPQDFAARVIEEKEELRFSEWVERDVYDGHNIELVTKTFKIIFTTDGEKSKKGFVETRTAQFHVMDWDGTETHYNKLFPEKPLRSAPVVVDSEEDEEDEGGKEAEKENVPAVGVRADARKGAKAKGGLKEKEQAKKAVGRAQPKKTAEDGKSAADGPKNKAPAPQVLSKVQGGRVQKRPGKGASVRK